MLNIKIGKNELEAENIIAIWGAEKSGKSFLLSKTAFQLTTQMGQQKRCMYVDEKMAEYFEEDMGFYLRTFTVLADEQESPVLVIDNLETLKESCQEFYTILKDRVHKRAWNLVYASSAMITDFNVDKNIILHTFRERNMFMADIINPAVNRMEDITVLRMEERKQGA